MSKRPSSSEKLVKFDLRVFQSTTGGLFVQSGDLGTMRRVIVSNAMSLDGFAWGPNGELERFAHKGVLKETELGRYPRTLLNSADAILLGRQTYEEFSSR